jgi:hypothetical protein
MKKFQEYLKAQKEVNESSLSRVWKHSQEHDTGTISAFRYAKDCGEGEVYDLSINKKNSQTLKQKLLALGYGVTLIKGTYIENYKTSDEKEVQEDSYLVVDLKDSGNLKRDLIKLGQFYEQDSITYSQPNGEYYLISSNKCPGGYPGKGKVGVEVKLGKPLFGQNGEFHSKINGRPFVFESLERFETLASYFPTEIRSILASLKEK